MQSSPQMIGGYKIVRELGRGAMGTVYLAYQESLGRDLAIKVMATEFTRDEEFIERFRREGRIAARLRHPNIVQVYDFSDREGQYFIAMEYLGSRTLKCLVREKGRVPLEQAVKLTDQVLAALEHAHAQGIVHRDIKPANVMLTDQGDAALTDFSIAQMKSASRLTQTGAALGTPEYMAPEQFEGKADGRADLYATGILLYEMLTGFSPFHAETIAEIMKKQLLVAPDPPALVDFTIPQAVSEVVVRSLAKDPDERYQSAQEMREALQSALLDPGKITAAQPPMPPPPVADAVVAVEAQVPAGKTCADCGKPVQNQRFCPGCGHDTTRPAKKAAPPVAAEISSFQRPQVASPPPRLDLGSGKIPPATRNPATPPVNLTPKTTLAEKPKAEAPPRLPSTPEVKTEAGKGLLASIDEFGITMLGVPSGLCLLAILPRLAFNTQPVHDLYVGGMLGMIFFLISNIFLSIFLFLRTARWNRILAPTLVATALCFGLILGAASVILPSGQ